MDGLYLFAPVSCDYPTDNAAKKMAAMIQGFEKRSFLASLRYFFSPSLALFIGKEQPGQ